MQLKEITMIKTELICATIGVEEFIERYRDVDKFLGFCRECNAYGKTWGCPPFATDITPKIQSYKYANLFGTKIIIDELIIDTPKSVEERTDLTYKIVEPVRAKLDDLLLQLEKEVSGSLVFFSGSCRRCAKGECTRPKGLPCAKPNEMRSSLESVGFDLSRCASELLHTEMKWSKDNRLPEYFIFVYAILTDRLLTDSELEPLRNII